MIDQQHAARRRIPSHAWFYPAATLYAAVAVPTSVAAMLMAICATAVALTIAAVLVQGASRSILDVGVALFALLLSFMGGRLIAPTVAGQIYRQGGNLEARVQPRVEGTLIIVLAIAIVVLALETLVADAAAIAKASGGALVLAGVLAGLRLARWRLWRLEKRPDLLCLGAGYGWLAIGLVLFGLTHARLAGTAADETLAIHVITIGSLGTLTLNVMAMTRLVLRLPAASTRLPIICTVLLGAATLLRVAFGSYAVSLLAAAVCWTVAYVLLLVVLLTGKRQAAARSPGSIRGS